ncbi:MAG: chromophore lyase CpcT/CpeT [Bacteroidetes bacterium]|nr:chromophore lyase CpcT/CpeT [Bacteroidota bacterium]
MKHQRYYLMLLLCLGLLQPIKSQRLLTQADVGKLAESMAGSYNSAKQSEKDTSYYNIVLHMVPIWPNEKNGKYLYVEQAMATQMDKPYRQRVYHLQLADDSTITSTVFEISSASTFINAWKLPHVLEQLTSDSLISRQGCAIYLRKNEDGNFVGSTKAKECLSTLRGAAYATSEVVIYKSKMVSWDRGWNAEDKQVWGAVKAGYQFIKE